MNKGSKRETNQTKLIKIHLEPTLYWISEYQLAPSMGTKQIFLSPGVTFMLFRDNVKFLGSLMVSIDTAEAEKKMSIQLELETTKERHKKEGKLEKN